jgi:hypothetical protein
MQARQIALRPGHHSSPHKLEENIILWQQPGRG